MRCPYAKIPPEQRKSAARRARWKPADRATEKSLKCIRYHIGLVESGFFFAMAGGLRMPPEFDMQAARAMCDSEWKLELQVKDATLLPKVENLVNRANMLPAALDEIDIRNRHIASLEAESEEQAKRMAELEGAAKADESRLIAAAKKAGIAYFGCDTPDHLADRVLDLAGNHCKDCCCARSWEALGITEYTGRSIPEEIKRLKDDLIASNHRYLDMQQICDDQDAQIAKQRAALKILGPRSGKRGKALVEERAKICSYDAVCPAEDDTIQDRWEFATLDERAQSLRDARQQLHQEGQL